MGGCGRVGKGFVNACGCGMLPEYAEECKGNEFDPHEGLVAIKHLNIHKHTLDYCDASTSSATTFIFTGLMVRMPVCD
eukprot:1324417-Amorphochlora_amoeboformis.AAC.1